MCQPFPIPYYIYFKTSNKTLKLFLIHVAGILLCYIFTVNCRFLLTKLKNISVQVFHSSNLHLKIKLHELILKENLYQWKSLSLEKSKN